MKLLPTLFILAAAQFSTAAFAGDFPPAPKNYHIECENCVTESQFIQVAKDHAVYRESVNINVMNFANYKIEKYRVYSNSITVCDPNGREPDGEGGFIYDCWFEKTLTATKISTSNTELNAFIDYATLQNDIRNIISQRSIEIPDTVVGSGYELLGASFRQTAVTNHFRNMPVHSTLFERFIMYTSAGTKMVSVGVVLNAPPLVFTFSDGTKAYADIEFYDMDDNLHIKFIKVVDAKGNVALLQGNKNPFSNLFNPQGTSATTWAVLREAFKAFGLAVDIRLGATVPSGIFRIIDCTGSTEVICRNPL